jgi:hypothetical protein
MSENVSQAAGPSLEDILWRAMDRFAERPVALDAEEFAARIAGAAERHADELARRADAGEPAASPVPGPWA